MVSHIDAYMINKYTTRTFFNLFQSSPGIKEKPYNASGKQKLLQTDIIFRTQGTRKVTVQWAHTSLLYVITGSTNYGMNLKYNGELFWAHFLLWL